LWKPFKTAANRKDEDEAVYQEGSWLGVVDRTDEAIIGNPQGVVRRCDVRRRPVEEQRDPEGLLSVVGWPSAPTPGKSSIAVPSSLRDAAEEPEDEEQREEVKADVDVNTENRTEEKLGGKVVEDQIKQMKIRRQDILKYGRTKGCTACQTADKEGETRSGMAHRDECRKHMQESMKSDEVDKDRVEGYFMRFNERLADHV
jgi:hypothetical protein